MSLTEELDRLEAENASLRAALAATQASGEGRAVEVLGDWEKGYKTAQDHFKLLCEQAFAHTLEHEQRGFRAGAEAMREAAAKYVRIHAPGWIQAEVYAAIRALPLPAPTESEAPMTIENCPTCGVHPSYRKP